MVKAQNQQIQSILNVLNGSDELIKKPARTPVTNKSPKKSQYSAFGVRVVMERLDGTPYTKTLISSKDSGLVKAVYEYATKAKGYNKVVLTALDGKTWVNIK